MYVPTKLSPRQLVNFKYNILQSHRAYVGFSQVKFKNKIVTDECTLSPRIIDAWISRIDARI
jgi:hypothetical protein